MQETQHPLQELEEQILRSEIPEDANDSREDIVSKVTKDMKKSIKSNPQNAAIVAIIAVTAIISTILLSNIISILSKNPQQQTESGESAATINGFEALVLEEEEESSMQSMDSIQQENIEQHTAVTNSQGEPPADITATTQQVQAEQEAGNKYYASPSIQSANPEDSLIQIGENIYKIPVNLRDLEAGGIHLITLGTKPPSEDVMLSPGKRDGYIQFGDERYRVKVSNGQECVYHDLTVVGITVENVSSASVYTFGGITIGSEEASIPASITTTIETDFAKTHTFYYYGTLTENSMFNKSGKRTSIISRNSTGKVDRIEVFNDATMN